MSRNQLIALAVHAALIAAAVAWIEEVAAAESDKPSAATAFPVTGGMVDVDLPASYRLPRIASRPSLENSTKSDADSLFFPLLPSNVSQDKKVDLFHAADIIVQNEAAVPENIEPIKPKAHAPPPTTTDLTVQLLPAVQRGYVLARRGAFYAARTEFIQVLRRVAQAKDISGNTDEHSEALAAGLRALDEADDFVPDGIQLEANLNVGVTASSHRTPVLGEDAEGVLPHQAVSLYHEFAQDQLGKAVAEEQAGSMALYGLGRIDAGQAAKKDDDLRFVRGAMTMYGAALAACPHNHLAANELGVLQCRTGRPDEATRRFRQAIDFAPSATAYHNLAIAQQKLGQHAQAHANEQESQRLASWERSRGTVSQRAGVAWVDPAEMARVAQPVVLTQPATQAVNEPAERRSPWQRTVDLTRSLRGLGSESAAEVEPNPAAATRVARPAARPGQLHWR